MQNELYAKLLILALFLLAKELTYILIARDLSG